MILRQLQIENFKCFQKKQTFDFGKITLLTGANSSGKSSVIHAILGALQSVDFPFYYSTNGDYVNMGSFKEIVYNHDLNSQFEISVLFDSFPKKISTTWKESTFNKLPQLVLLKVGDEEFNCPLMLLNTAREHGEEIIDIENTIRAIREYTPKINYIGAFRLDPQRTYLEKNRKDEKVGKSGDGYLEQILSWQTYESDKFEILISEMRNLHLLEDVNTERLDGGRYEVKVKTKGNEILSSLSDVGYGISQFLPIMVADLQLPDNSQLFLSQPEIHLHPSVQSSFGDYLVRQINKSDKRYVVETHSEYLLNKLRLAIVKGELKQEDISVYYLENNGVDTSVHKIQFEKNGQINGAPSSFFETYMTDSMEIVLNATD